MVKDKTNEVDERAGDREVAVSDLPPVAAYDLDSAMDGCLEKVVNNLCGTDGESEAVETKSESEDGDSESVHEVDMNGLDHLDLWPEQKPLGTNQEQQVLISAPPDQDSKTEEQVPSATIEIGTEATANEEQTPEIEETTAIPEANETETNPPRTLPSEPQSTGNTSNAHEQTTAAKDVITMEPTLEQTLSIGSHEVDAKTEEQVPTEEAGKNTSKQTCAASDLTEEAEDKTEVRPAPADHSADSPDDTKAAEQEKVDTKTEEQVETKTEEQVDTETEEQAEIEIAEKVETKTEEQVETKTEEQVESEVEEQDDIETEEQAEIETVVEVDTKTEEQVETKTEEQADIDTEDQVDTKTEEKVPIPVQDVLRPKELQPVNETKTEEQVPPPWPIQKQTTEPDASAEGSQSTQKQQPKQNKDTLFPEHQLVEEEEEEDEDQGPLSVMVASQHELPAAEEAQEAMAKVTKELEILSLKESEEHQKALQKQLEREKKIAARRERVQRYAEQDRQRKTLRKQLREATATARKEWTEKQKERKRELNEKKAKQLIEDEIKYQRHIAKIKHKQEKAKSVWKPVQKYVMMPCGVV